MKTSHALGIMLTSAAVLLLGGCARNISSNTYKASHVGEASMSYQGVIVSARGVTVDEGEYLEDNKTGIGLGALGGGVIGNQFGRGGGNLAATAAGAVIGGTAGAFAEKALKSQNGMEYVVRLNNGSMMTVVQAPEPALAAGQRVLVLVGQKGRSRVIADSSSYSEAQPLVVNQYPAAVVPPAAPAYPPASYGGYPQQQQYPPAPYGGYPQQQQYPPAYPQQGYPAPPYPGQ